MLIATVPAMVTAWTHPKAAALSTKDPGISEVTIWDVSRWKTPHIWVDARRSGAFQKRHISGALLLNEGEWEKLLPRLLAAWSPGTRIVVYCDSEGCDASREVASRLQRELGISEVYVLQGGWSAWLTSQE